MLNSWLNKILERKEYKIIIFKSNFFFGEGYVNSFFVLYFGEGVYGYWKMLFLFDVCRYLKFCYFNVGGKNNVGMIR